MLELPGIYPSGQRRQLFERLQPAAHREDADPQLAQEKDDDEPAAVGDEFIEHGGIDGLQAGRDLLDLRGECPLLERGLDRGPR